jgi:hypothetical protein
MTRTPLSTPALLRTAILVAVGCAVSACTRTATELERLAPRVVPDATAPVAPAPSTIGTLLDRDSLAAGRVLQRDSLLSADPDGASRGTIAYPYLARTAATRDTAPRSKGAARSAADSILVLAAPVNSTPPVVSVHRDSASSSAPVRPPSPQADSSSARTPAPASVPDSIDTWSDSATAYLQIRPTLDHGRLAPSTIEHVATAVASDRAEGRVVHYLILVEAHAADAARADLLLDDAYALRRELVARGAAADMVVVRERAVSDGRGSRLRIVMRRKAP